MSISRRRTVSAAELGAAAVRSGSRRARWYSPDDSGQPGRLYVPGGLAPLASSVIMNVVPAQVAGVGIALASPPQADFGGLPHPGILALCHLLGVEEVYAVGGAQAIAMFAYGVPELCRRVNLVTGPGNIYVVAAKRLLKGRVNIDSEAGPTEIAVLADDTADPVHVAADLISQAEHDPLAAAVLVTDSAELADAVRPRWPSRWLRPNTSNGSCTPWRTAVGRRAGRRCRSWSGRGERLRRRAPGDADRDPGARAAKIINAGAIFVGPWSPVSLGDYCAGSTHVLPTAGCACHSSGLNVKSFLKAVQVVIYSRDALGEVARSVEVFADAEDLPAHGAAVTLRFVHDDAHQ